MRWQGRRESDNIEDRRAISPRGVAVGGGLGAILVVLFVALMGGDPQQALNQLGASESTTQTRTFTPEEEARKKFVSVVLADTEDVWNRILPEQTGKPYVEPKLVLFSGQVESACGYASAAMGPFYCPSDSQVYIDLSFFDELQQRFGAPGEFAQAYVVAHEVGHHVQRLLGITDRVHSQQGRISKKAYNELSVRLELQADFLAGVWAHHAQRMKNILDQKDIMDALNAAAAIGDDKLQKEAQGYIVPESFTHGTSEQRMYWFKKGWETGDLKYGDTFSQVR
jgi:predicted metalloprotease